jgi:hypothetical protein
MRRNLIHCLLFGFLAILWPAVAQAQSAVSVIGPVTAGHCTSFFSQTQLQDAGITCSGGGGGSVPGVYPAVICDGVTNNYAIIAAAVVTANANGADIVFPPGPCVIDMTGQPTMSLNGGLIGAGESTFQPPNTPNYLGTVFLIKGTTASPFTVIGPSHIRNIAFEWPTQTNPASLTAFPPAIVILNTAQVVIDNITMINAYTGIQITGSSGFVWIENSRFSAFSAAILVGTTAAENYFINNDFTYGWGFDFYNNLGQLAAFQAAMQATAIGISFNGVHADAQTITGNTFVGLGVGISVSHTGVDSFLWGTINSNIFDGALIAISFSGTSRPNQIAITGNDFENFAGGGAPEIAFTMSNTTANYSATITGNHFTCNVLGGHIEIVSPSGQSGDVTIAGNDLNCQGDTASSGGPYYSMFFNAPGLNATVSGNVIDGFGNSFARGIDAVAVGTLAVNGNSFLAMNAAISLTSVNAATIIGNTAASVTSPVSGTASTFVETHNTWDTAYTVAQVLEASPVSLTNNTPLTITSIFLGPGDYDVCGSLGMTFGAGAAVTQFRGSISPTTNAMNVSALATLVTLSQTGPPTVAFPVPCVQALLTSSATYYLIAQSAFSGGTAAGFGTIWARRH